MFYPTDRFCRKRCVNRLTYVKNRIILIPDREGKTSGDKKFIRSVAESCHTFSIQLLPKKRKPAERPVFVFLLFCIKSFDAAHLKMIPGGSKSLHFRPSPGPQRGPPGKRSPARHSRSRGRGKSQVSPAAGRCLRVLPAAGARRIAASPAAGRCLRVLPAAGARIARRRRGGGRGQSMGRIS